MTTLTLYGHPFSSYCQKARIALYEKALDFDYAPLTPENPQAGEALARLWPLGKFPVLVADGRTLPEASIIVEYVDSLAPGDAPLLPADPHAALEARLLDRVFDNYVMAPMQAIVKDALYPPGQRSAIAVAEARALLDKSYAWLERALAGRTWACGSAFTLADCAAAPALFYADWVHPIGESRAVLAAYRARLLARPSVARAVDEARPYRAMFPLGDPGRD